MRNVAGEKIAYRSSIVWAAVLLAGMSAAAAAVAGEFVMKSGKGYGVCEALKRNLNALDHDRAQLCERKIHPSVRGLKVLSGKPLDPSQYVEFLINQLDIPERQVGRHIETEGARTKLKEAIAEGRVRMELIEADVNNDGRSETWFWYYREAPAQWVDSACNVPHAVSQVFLMNEAGDAFDYKRMRGLSRNGTRIIQYGKRTYVDKEFHPTGFGVYQEVAAGFIPICEFGYEPVNEILNK